MARRWRKHLVVVTAAAALSLSGCGMLPGGLSGLAEDDGEEVTEVDDVIDGASDAEDGAADAEPAGEGLEPLPVAPQQMDAAVHVAALEFTVTDMDVVDLDAEAGRDTRLEGARLVFNGSVTNPTSDSLAANSQVALQWDEGAHSFESSGRVDSAPVPGGASGPLEFEINLNPEQLDTFNSATAMLLLGQSGASRAQIPLGTGELITRIPVPQEDLVGQSFDIDGQVSVTIEEADLRWDVGGGTEDGTAVLELAVTLENNSDRQRCWSRGEGNNFSLVNADGTGTVDLRMSDRGCTPSGDRSVAVTGIPVHEDYAGDYTLTHHHTIDFDDFQDTIEFTMVDGPGVLLSER